MTASRLPAPAGIRVDRSQRLSFEFNGRALSGHPGDTLASALLANGVQLVGRSFKLHRPRGIFSCGIEEPTGLVDLGVGAARTPNMRATVAELYDGLIASSVNCWPSVEFDLLPVPGNPGPGLGVMGSLAYTSTNSSTTSAGMSPILTRRRGTP